MRRLLWAAVRGWRGSPGQRVLDGEHPQPLPPTPGAEEGGEGVKGRMAPGPAPWDVALGPPGERGVVWKIKHHVGKLPQVLRVSLY